MAVSWTHKFSDLLAVGVHIDVEAMHVLDMGGEVLSLEILPAPDSWLYGDGDVWTMADMDGEVVMVPFILKVTNPALPFYQGQTMNPVSIADHLEENIGEDWRLFPSYVGEKTNTATEDPRGMNEYPIPVRIWNAIPLLTEDDKRLANTIVTAHRMMIAVSYYEELVTFYQMSMELNEGWSDLNIDDLSNEQAIQYWELRTKLAQKGYIVEDKDGDNRAEDSGWSEGRSIDLDPIEMYLKDLSARQMWSRLRHESRQGANRIFHSVPLDKQSIFIHHEKEYEPWF